MLRKGNKGLWWWSVRHFGLNAESTSLPQHQSHTSLWEIAKNVRLFVIYHAPAEQSWAFEGPNGCEWVLRYRQAKKGLESPFMVACDHAHIWRQKAPQSEILNGERPTRSL